MTQKSLKESLRPYFKEATEEQLNVIAGLHGSSIRVVGKVEDGSYKCISQETTEQSLPLYIKPNGKIEK